VTVSTGGVITGFTFVPGTAAAMTSPTSMPLHLLALQKAASEPIDSDGPLRSAIVNVAGYYLKLAQTSTPAQMEAIIWGKDSVDGADHGPSCAAFASLTLELAAQAVGKQSWVTGGSSYPWPLHDWADVRVDPNPDSLDITSMVQDAQAHGRWHPIGDGYQPLPGDWVLFSGHVEVVTGYTGGELHTIGADSLPNFTVNAHSFPAPFADQGVAGFVDNGHLGTGQPAVAPRQTTPRAAATRQASPAGPGRGAAPQPRDEAGLANIPGTRAAPAAPPAAAPAATPATAPASAQAAAPATPPAHPAAPAAAATGAGTGAVVGAAAEAAAAIPGVSVAAGPVSGAHSPAAEARPGPYRKYAAPDTAAPPQARTQQAFISLIAPGAIAAQQHWGVPASVTIAQAIDESGWGRSKLAAQDYNLFGIKGKGPAGSVEMPTGEYVDGKWVTVNAAFRSYHNIAESIADHAELLATSGYYQRAMADRAVPDAFANDLTGIYATDPEYGANLIALMKLYNLYRFDAPAAPPHAAAPAPASATAPATHAPTPAPAHPTAPASVPGPAQSPTAAPGSAAIPGAAPLAASAPWYSSAPSHPQPRTTRTTRPAAPVRGSVAQPRTTRSPSRDASRGDARIPGLMSPSPQRYQPELPTAVTTAFFTSAKTPLARAEPLYRDVAARFGIPWQLLAACDWMQCQAQPRYSPVHGEKIGMPNTDGTVYLTKSEALAQCASDLVGLTAAVYGIDLTRAPALSVRELADAFAAFRWGALLMRHRVSAMEFPYAVAGLTPQHLKMHWPVINEPDAPDKPGGKFRQPFGAVPVVLSLNLPVTV